MIKFKIAALLPYANPHVLGWLSLLKNKKRQNLLIGCVNSVRDYRDNYFSEVDQIPDIIYFFKENPKIAFYNKLRKVEFFISLGMFNFQFIKSIFHLNKNCQIFILSEPYRQVSSSKHFLQRLFRILVCKIIKQENIVFLAMGGTGVKEHYISIGFTKSKFYNFGYFPDMQVLKTVEKNSTNQKIKFLFVGQLIPRKGIDILIRLIEYLDTKHTDNFHFTIIGDGILREKLVLNIKNKSAVKYEGLIQNKEVLNSFYLNADVFFLPSYFDGWGAVVNEALAYSCSLLLSKYVYSSQALLLDSKNGFLFDPYDFVSLCNKVDEYFADRNLLKDHCNFSSELYKEWNENNAAASFRKLINGEKLSNLTLLREL